MDKQQLARMYEEASALAEAGRHEAALHKMSEYLQHCPQDGRAINDAATLLFCLGRGREAIVWYQKAARFCQADQLAQVYWNLCEACLEEDLPAGALACFDTMQEMGLLSADLLNRTADALLRQEMLGPAMELLLRSLRLNPEQEILLPMIEVIRSHRARTAVIVQNKTELARSLAEGLSRRLVAKVHREESSRPVALPADTDIALFFGCGPSLVHASMQNTEMRCIAILDAQDMLDPRLRTVRWAAVHTLILCGGGDMTELLAEQVGPLPASLRILAVEPIPNPEHIAFSPRKKGKRIAAVGPWDARSNPMFALMCFQKLHFIDADTRLHLAGEFSDPLTERYVRQTLETLGLESVVFIDGPVKDLKKWLKDKHYILSTAIDGVGMENVWTAMACGLRPLVHNFPGAAEQMDSRYLFTLAEDFCRQTLDAPFDAAEHRAAVEQRFETKGLEPAINELIFQLEQERPPQSRRRPVRPTVQAAGAAQTVPNTPTLRPNPAARPARAKTTSAGGTTTKPMRQIATEVQAATQKLEQIAQRLNTPSQLSPSDPPVQEPGGSSADVFRYNRAEESAAFKHMQEDRSAVPFPAGR